MEKAIFAAGCFWAVEKHFQSLKGVMKTLVGYTGGHYKNPTYEQVSTGSTGHTEAVFLEFEPKLITYEKLLHNFWSIHDPTTVSRQGPDIGTQYRSAIFFYNKKQEAQARKSLEEHQKTLSKAIVTEILRTTNFYGAEEYHQSYLKKKELNS